jgi:hypothetical protein
MFCFKLKVMLQWVGMFSKRNTCDGGSIRAMMGSASENFGFEMIKLRPGG